MGVGGAGEGTSKEEGADANEGDDEVGEEENVGNLQDIGQQAVGDGEGEKVVGDKREEDAV